MDGLESIRKYDGRVLLWVTMLFLVTLIHHVYGGIAFESTERLVLASVFSVLMAVTVVSAVIMRRHDGWSGKVGWLYWVTILFWIIGVGVYEGGYNHSLFVLLRALGADQEVIGKIYPSGVELGSVAADNVFFQATGVLTLLAVGPVVYAVVRGRYRAVSD